MRKQCDHLDSSSQRGPGRITRSKRTILERSPPQPPNSGSAQPSSIQAFTSKGWPVGQIWHPKHDIFRVEVWTSLKHAPVDLNKIAHLDLSFWNAAVATNRGGDILIASYAEDGTELWAGIAKPKG